MQDICLENVLYAFPQQAATDARLVEGKVYIIDFHTSRQLALGPGRQPAIVLPSSQEKKPAGVATALDPYSFDVFCAGRLMQFLLKVRPRLPLPWTRMDGSSPDGIICSSRSSRSPTTRGSLADTRSGWWATTRSAGAPLSALVVRQPTAPVKCSPSCGGWSILRSLSAGCSSLQGVFLVLVSGFQVPLPRGDQLELGSGLRRMRVPVFSTHWTASSVTPACCALCARPHSALRPDRAR